MARVALVIVSHSDLLARGVTELASQMAPDVVIEPAGGMEDLSLGTSYDRVDAARERAESAVGGVDGGGLVFLSDIGSATMTIESVLEFADCPDRCVFVEAPLVEGAIAAAVRAQLGDDLSSVASAAQGAASAFSSAVVSAPSMPSPAINGGAQPEKNEETVEADVVVADPVGLHARPAAMLARLAGSFESDITINGADASSVLDVMSLGIAQGQSVHLVATGLDAAQAVQELVEFIEST
ncbi:MAG: dihydroxyacetone kinase [Actinobacteria bacterium]|nr:MAG: dihydroxyacetone kinase [Actinomycetota bacterium]